MKKYTIQAIDGSILIVISKGKLQAINKAMRYFGHGLFRRVTLKGMA